MTINNAWGKMASDEYYSLSGNDSRIVDVGIRELEKFAKIIKDRGIYG